MCRDKQYCRFARLPKERAESLMKYISSTRDIIDSQVRHRKRRVTSRGGQLCEEKVDSMKGEKIVESIVIW